MGLQRRQFVIVAVLISAAMAYLVFTGMRDTMVFYYTVSEVMMQQDDLAGTPLRVAGKVVPGTIEISNLNHLDRTFIIHEGGAQLPVVYHGIVPDTLVDDAEAVVEGKLGADGVFEATHVLAKCPSKYESETDYRKYREAGVEVRAQTST